MKNSVESKTRMVLGLEDVVPNLIMLFLFDDTLSPGFERNLQLFAQL